MKVVKVSHAVSSPAEEKLLSVNKIPSLGNCRGFFVSAFHRAPQRIQNTSNHTL
jgi:hypothetical protein